jgi:thiol-disulfide isomerase/thioredoxin
MLRWLRRQAQQWRSHLLTLLIALAAMLAVQAWQTRDVGTGALAPELLTQPVTLLWQGQAQTTTLAEALARVRGDDELPVGLYVWADWCPVCRTMRGMADGFAQDHPMLSIAMRSGPNTQVQSYLQEHALNWPTLVDPSGALARALGFGAVPAFATVSANDELATPTVGLTSSWGMRLRWWWARFNPS